MSSSSSSVVLPRQSPPDPDTSVSSHVRQVRSEPLCALQLLARRILTVLMCKLVASLQALSPTSQRNLRRSQHVSNVLQEAPIVWLAVSNVHSAPQAPIQELVVALSASHARPAPTPTQLHLSTAHLAHLAPPSCMLEAASVRDVRQASTLTCHPPPSAHCVRSVAMHQLQDPRNAVSARLAPLPTPPGMRRACRVRLALMVLRWEQCRALRVSFVHLAR